VAGVDYKVAGVELLFYLYCYQLLDTQDSLRPLLGQTLPGIAVAIVKCAASGLNQKSNTIPWAGCSFTWGSADGTSADVAGRARMCASHLAACVEASKGFTNYAYSGDKGFAGALFMALLFFGSLL